MSIHIYRNMCVLTYGYRNAIALDYFKFYVETFFYDVCAESFFLYIGL